MSRINQNVMDKVTCICSTYGRPHVLKEAIQSFLEQDYDNKELLILNDNAGFPLKLDNSQIKIINLHERCQSLGQKRNLCVSLSSHDSKYMCIWEDDDLSMPWRISRSIQFLEAHNNYDAVKTIKAIASENNEKYHIAFNAFEGSACWRSEFLRKHKYNESLSVRMDLEMENQANVAAMDPTPDFWYVYRWGCGVFHLSGAGEDTFENWERAGTVKNDSQILQIGYDNDYWADITNFIANNHPEMLERWRSNFNC